LFIYIIQMNFNKEYVQFRKNKKYKHQNIYDFIKEGNVFFGSGGSENIIVKMDDRSVLKIVPILEKDPNWKENVDNNEKEIEFYKFFTKEFILTNITPHIVGYFDNYKLLNITKMFPKKCLTIDEKFLVNPKKLSYVNEKLCELKNMHKFKLIKNTADVIVLENCPISIGSIISRILNSKKGNKHNDLKELLDRTIFQLIYTLTAIQHSYPTFIHNDLFLRNILGKIESEYDNNDYVEYKYNGVSYYLKANGFYMRINDFGYSLLPPIIMSKTFYESVRFNPIDQMSFDDKLKDTFTFLYDLYNGQNLGHWSVMSYIRDEDIGFKREIKKLFKKYMDVNLIDKITKYNKNLLDMQWNIKHTPLLRKTIMEPKLYFKKGTFDKYRTKPKDANIVKTFQIN